jgi:glycosyltransferase involved in cell wall biosynthesis
MKIGISAFAADNGRSGIGQYVINMLDRMPGCDERVSLVVFAPRDEREALNTDHPRVQMVWVSAVFARPMVSVLWHLLLFPMLLRLHRVDCAFMPAGNRRLALWYGVPSVSTVHDLSQLHVEHKYDGLRMAYVKRVLPVMMRRLSRVVTVSASTAKDLVEFAQIDARRIRVVPNGTDGDRFRARGRFGAAARVRSALSIDEPYILYTARLEHPGKNHVRLVEAFAKLRREGRIDHRLVLAGGRWNGVDAIEAAIDEAGVREHVLLPGFIPNDLLPDLYAAADLFVFPSLFEGFGIPLLEAMHSAVPVVAARISSIPEVVGDAAVLFDPYDVDDLSGAIERALYDSVLRATLIARGLERAKRFTWDRAARDVLDLCREAAAA